MTGRASYTLGPLQVQVVALLDRAYGDTMGGLQLQDVADHLDCPLAVAHGVLKQLVRFRVVAECTQDTPMASSTYRVIHSSSHRLHRHL